MGPCILEVHEIRAIFGQVHGFVAIWPNKSLSGEFHVFHGKMVIIWLWALPWKFGGKIKF